MQARTPWPSRARSLSALIAVAGATAIPACYKAKGSATSATPERSNVVEVRHAELSATDVRDIRREQKRDVWIRIVDANRLIYTYAAEGTQLADDRQARDDFQKLLGGVPGGAKRRAADSATTSLKAALGAPLTFEEFAVELLVLRDVIRQNIIFTDTASGSTVHSIERGRKNVEDAASRLFPFVDDTASAVARVQTLYAALDGPAKVLNEPLRAAAVSAAPAVVRWRGEFLRAVGGAAEVQYEYAGTGDYLIELSVKNRLGEAYQPARWVGSGADVALTKPKFKPFQVSLGLGGLQGDRIEAELVQVSAKGASVDTFEVRQRKVGKLSILPSTFFSVQHGLRQSPWTVGGTLGVGLRSDEVANVAQATDLMGLVTIGYDWMRVSVGAAYTTEITGFNGTFRGAGADSTRSLTTDANALQRTDRTRKKRLVMAIHMTR